MSGKEQATPEHPFIEAGDANVFGDAAATTIDLMDAIHRATFEASWARTHPPRAAGSGAHGDARPANRPHG